MSGTGDTERDEPATSGASTRDDERTGTAVDLADREDGAEETPTGSDTGTDAGTDPASDPASDPDEETAVASTDDDLDDDVDDLEDEDERRRPSWALTITLGAVAVLAVAALAVTTLIVPGWAVKPGSPDDTANEVTTALALKDAGAIEAASCRNQQGGTANPFPPDLLGLITNVRTAGPARMQLDTQATAPIDLSASAGGRTQTLPADLILAVNDGQWCLAGISQRQ
jgi:hypothetical protein